MKKLISMAAVAALLFTGCAKDGDTGPAGATGATGAAGPDAKVYMHPVVYLTGDMSSVFTFDTPIQSSDVVLVYINNIGTTIYSPLPFKGMIDNVTLDMYFNVSTDNVFINNRTPVTAAVITDCKIVVISGHYRQANPNVDYNNYAEVASTFNLE
jgi:hypothetical protein